MKATTSLPRALLELAALEPERPAITCGGQTVSRAELARSAARLARAYATFGVCAGDFVTIGLPNGVEFVNAVLASWQLGAVPQPVSPLLSTPERDALLDLVRPALVVGIPAGDRNDCAHIPAGFEPAPSLPDEPLPDVVPPAWKAPASGGSTGRPKVIIAGEPGELEEVQVYADLFRIDHRAVMLITGPLYHNGPFMHALLALLRGGHVVVMERFDPLEALELVARDRVTNLYAVPTMVQRLWNLPEAVRLAADVSSLRTALLTAAPCPAWLKRAFVEWLGPDRVVEIYGGTEAQAMTLITGREMLERPGSVGRAGLGEVRVVDAGGQPCPPGVIGQIRLRRDAGAPRTYRYVGASPDRIEGGWEWLGDDGHVDEDGYLYVDDRRVDLILVGGANVYPAEVEAVLDEHPQVASSCVIGLPDEDLGAVPHAIVQPVGDLDEAALRVHVDKRLVRYKRPRSYEFVAQPLRDASGKVRRSAVRGERLGAVQSPAGPGGVAQRSGNEGQ